MIELFWGANSFELQQRVRQVVSDMKSQAGDHAVIVRDGSELTTAELDTLFVGGSLFATEQLVIIKGVASTKSLWDVLPDYLDRASETTHIVFVEHAPDKRTKTYKWLHKNATLTEFPLLREHELITWVERIVKKWDGTISRSTASELVERVGDDQWLLWSELKKLRVLNVHITSDAVRSIVEATPHATVFELIEAALAGKDAHMLNLLAGLSLTEDPYRFFGLLSAQVAALASIVAAPHVSAENIAQQVGLHPFVVKKNMALARRLNDAQMSKIIDALVTADARTKTTGADPWVVLRACLYKISVISVVRTP